MIDRNFILKPVTQSELLRIAGLVAALVNLPITISFFRIPVLTDENLPEVSLVYLLFRLVFFFLFSYTVLQFNANFKYRIYNYGKITNRALSAFINIGIYGLTLLLLFLTLSPITGREPGHWEVRFFFVVFGVVHIILLFISGILRLLVIRQENILENERLQQQNLQKELSALRNQLNPHFLFNSLNTLNSLIRDNTEATQFVNKLSYMYRYILQSGERDLVCLRDELKFLESYAFLIKTRYHQYCFKIDTDISEEHMQMEIPPMALQLLVENAVKHNEISKGCPLHIKIYSKEDFLVVENKIHPRNTPVEGTGNGLINLDKRYFLLRKKKIVISQEDDTFKVQLPLISGA